VGSWGTFKIKQAIQDAARILEHDMHEAMRLTKTLNEEEYEIMDADEICQHNQDFKNYYERNKEVIDLALQLRGRIKSQGKHAGGIIISSKPLSDTIPMSFKDGTNISQWTEGMASTQLSPFGLVKFDILGLKTMAYNVYTEELIHKTTGIIIDWSESDPSCEVPYAGHQILPDGTKIPILFNDEKAIKMADEIKTEAVFQFDTPVAKGVLANGVTSFHDLVTYTALARPGPMDCIPMGELINTENGYVKIEKLNGEKIQYNSKNGVKNTNNYKVFYSGKKKIFKIKLKNGKIIKCSGEHRIMTEYGFKQVKNIKEGEFVHVKKNS
jgi:DNA polymerase-3 subunit alpha